MGGKSKFCGLKKRSAFFILHDKTFGGNLTTKGLKFKKKKKKDQKEFKKNLILFFFSGCFRLKGGGGHLKGKKMGQLPPVTGGTF